MGAVKEQARVPGCDGVYLPCFVLFFLVTSHFNVYTTTVDSALLSVPPVT